MTGARQSYLNAAFLVCAALLLTAAGTKTLVIQSLGVVLTKEAVPLQRPLDELDEAALAPYEVRNKAKIENRDVLESLGTEDYLQWILEDPDAAPGSPTRYCSLFVTYYTGNPDMVPHVPDECYVGGGNTRASAEQPTVRIPTLDNADLSFQYVIFEQLGGDITRQSTRFSVQYLFYANGDYCGNRTETRKTLGQNFFSKYSYFSKVEWKFYGFDAFGMTYPDKAQTLAASKKLLAVVLPELQERHWPDWDAINAPEAAVTEEPQARR